MRDESTELKGEVRERARDGGDAVGRRGVGGVRGVKGGRARVVVPVNGASWYFVCRVDRYCIRVIKS